MGVGLNPPVKTVRAGQTMPSLALFKDEENICSLCKKGDPRSATPKLKSCSTDWKYKQYYVHSYVTKIKLRMIMRALSPFRSGRPFSLFGLVDLVHLRFGELFVIWNFANLFLLSVSGTVFRFRSRGPSAWWDAPLFSYLSVWLLLWRQHAGKERGYVPLFSKAGISYRPSNTSFSRILIKIL